MHRLSTTSTNLPTYEELQQNLQALIEEEQDWLVSTANFAALLFQSVPNLNWAGFYFWRSGQLVLGPFQGKPACMRIAFGHGVCGTAAKENRTIIVSDVHQFPGHIACDQASQSEIVVPLNLHNRFLGVLDLDSPHKARFTQDDAEGLQILTQILVDGSDWESLPE